MIVRKSFFNNFYFEKKRKEKQRSNSIYYRNTNMHILILNLYRVGQLPISSAMIIIIVKTWIQFFFIVFVFL